MRWWLALILWLGVEAKAFELQPWFPFPYEFHFRAGYFASYFSDVDGGIIRIVIRAGTRC